jgi:hypothetical protein
LPAALETLGQNAFSYSTSLVSIELPETLKSLGNQVFRESGLVSVAFPASLETLGTYVLRDCTALKSVEFAGDRVTTIVSSVFVDCTALETVELPPSLESIGTTAFSGCTALESIKLPATLTSIGTSAFSGCMELTTMEIPTSMNITSWGSTVFSGCRKLSFVITGSGGHFRASADRKMLVQDNILVAYPSAIADIVIAGDEGITGIGAYLFYNLTTIASVQLPAGLESIGTYAFSGCTYLTISGSLPASLTSIGPYAFNGCTRLTLGSPTLPPLLQTLEARVFYNCTTLGEVTLPPNLQSIETYAFALCTNLTLTSPTLPASLNSIGTYAFRNCSSLEEVVLPSGIGEITTYAFNGCSSLTSIEIPATVTTIGTYAFQNCTLLEEIDVLGTEVASIGANACNGCPALEKFILRNQVTPPTVTATSFSLTTSPSLQIYVPDAEVTNYQNTGIWQSSYAAKIVGVTSL